MTPSMRPVALAIAVAATVLVAGCTSPSGGNPAASAQDSGPTEALEAVPMVNHVQFGVFEQDVYVERLAGEPGKVYRATPADAANPVVADGPLYANAQAEEHDPTFQHDGPFDKGERLPFTLAEWLAGSGSAAYLCTDGETARIDASFTGLVPNGVYTFWNARLQMEDGAIVGARDLPAGAADGSQNTFIADDEGNAHFEITWEGCTEPSTAGPGLASTGDASVFAIAYHSDGKTYGPEPGPFGKVTHVQLFGMLKARKA